MVEFTGERVIPGQVDPDLWSEHLARYAFAGRYAASKQVLDCGCGTGYGSAELAETAACVTGLDISEDAIEYARTNYARTNTRYLTGSCLDLNFPNESFNLLVAFEVIEHLTDYRRFLQECTRVLSSDGRLIVSTPNKNYYAESRAGTGPNPFHEHEFEPREFEAELLACFPHVELYLQNRVECFAFTSGTTLQTDARVDGDHGAIEQAHFIIGLCSKSDAPVTQSFLYVPSAANLLREREQHILLLKDHLAKTQSWLDQTIQDRDKLLDQYRDQLAAYDKQKTDLEVRNRWAQSLSASLDAERERVGELQDELAREQSAARQMASGYDTKISELEAENAAKTKWALETDERLKNEIEHLKQQITETLRHLDSAENTVVERTKWAQELESRLNAVRNSRWLRLGRTLGLGPKLQ